MAQTVNLLIGTKKGVFLLDSDGATTCPTTCGSRIMASACTPW